VTDPQQKPVLSADTRIAYVCDSLHTTYRAPLTPAQELACKSGCFLLDLVDGIGLHYQPEPFPRVDDQ
jgi:hypothetical protein